MGAIGAPSKVHILGIINQKEDMNYYIEDKSSSLRIVFHGIEGESIESDYRVFITINSIVIAGGYFKENTFYATNLISPPLL